MTTLAAARDSLMSTFATLRTEALDARAAGDHARAADAWRALLDHAPEDPALALELKHDLRAGLHYPDSDPRFRRAARFLPDDAWLAHYSALYAFHGSDLDAIAARATVLHARWPGDPRLDAIRGDVARQRRDWPTAERAFRAAARLHPHRTDWAAQADDAARYAALAAQPMPAQGTPYAISVLNLDRNPERMVEIERQFVTTLAPWHRIPGIEGSRLPASAVARLTGSPQSPRGTLGCFLSHAAAWEALLSRGDPAALIVEDDVIPLLDLPARLAGPLDPAGYDILFVNDRLAPRHFPGGATAGLSSEPLATAMQAFHPDNNAPGADGYVLTAPAASTLLAWVERDGMAGDVDWRLLAYALTPNDIATLAPHAHARYELTRYAAAIPRPDRLRARVLTPALIRTVGVSSDREDQNRLHPS